MLRLRSSQRGHWASAVALASLCVCAPAFGQSGLDSGDGSGADNLRLEAGVYPADPVLASNAGVPEPGHPFFDVDWSLALRGSYVSSSDEDSFETRLIPSFELERIGSRAAVRLGGDMELTRPDNGDIDVTALRLEGEGGYDLDSVTRLTYGADISLTQDIAGAPGVSDTISQPPSIATGGVTAGATRQFGKFNIGVTGAAERLSYGDTELIDGSTIDNSDRDYWGLDGNLRVGYQATPIFEVFGEAGLGRDIFDVPSASLGIRTDATTATLVGGVTGRWNSVWEATASTGIALRRFDEDSLGEVVTQLYDASVTFRPDPTWRFTAGLSTNVEPPGPDTAGTTRIEYAAIADIGYTVNSWLALRAAANWTEARFEGSGATESRYGYGLGADYALNARTALTADYSYEHSDSTIDGTDDSHRVTLGVTLSR